MDERAVRGVGAVNKVGSYIFFGGACRTKPKIFNFIAFYIFRGTSFFIISLKSLFYVF